MSEGTFNKTILITGGAGFIGSHVVRRFVNKYSDHKVINLDKLTYAGNLENLKDVEDNPNYKFIRGDVADADFINGLFKQTRFDGIIHLAAESHVDRSCPVQRAVPLDLVEHAEAIVEIDQVRAAAQQHVLAVVDDLVVPWIDDARRAAAEHLAALDNDGSIALPVKRQAST